MTDMGGQFAISHVVGTGDFSHRLDHIVHGQLLYRVGLVLQLLASVFTVLLAYALYEVLKPVNDGIARLALYFRLAQAFAGVNNFIAFASLSLQTDTKYLYIPRALSALGLFASFVTLPVSIANLLYPEYASTIQFGWIPIFIAEIATGVWLLVRGVRIEPAPGSSPAPVPA